MCAFQGFKSSLALALALLIASAGFAQTTSRQSRAEAEFFRGYYLEHETENLEEAVKAYKRAIELGANAKLRSAIDVEMARLQEELATADFAKLMPAEAIAYLEISNPATHVESVARLIGLTGKTFIAGDDKITIPIEDGIAISSDFQISPALLREFKKIRGAAISITGLNEHGVPSGVAVIHPGDSDLITGLLETGMQLVPATDKIGGFPTFNVEEQVWIVKTKRLVIVSSDKSEVANCLKRITSEAESSLADDKNFELAKSKNRDAAVFAFASPQKAVKTFEHMLQGEMALARMVLDLDHMQYVSTALMATDNGLRTKLNVKFSDDHNSFGYGMIRTVPLSRNALSHVPAGSVAVVGMGLNPKLLLAAQAAGEQQLSALDIGREVFANIEELGLFVMPSTTGGHDRIPNVGLVIASSDVDKSESLWNQLLSLPALMDLDEGPTAKSIKLEGIDAREYTFGDDDIPQLIIARLGDNAMVAGTRDAVAAAIAAGKNGQTLANDSRAAAFWEANSEFTSKAAFVHAGRALKLAASMSNGRDADEMRMISEVLQELVVTMVVNEAPAELEIQTDLVGLPQFADVVKAVAKFQPQRRSHRPVRVVDTALAEEPVRAKPTPVREDAR